MTISKELMLALIESDVYYNDGKALGTATVEQFSLPAGSTDSGFYALVYTIGDGVEGLAPGTKVIAFRGLADPGAWSTALQIADVPSSQALQALQFYNSVVSSLGGDASKILLAGFSLGGALAGFVASLTGAPSVIFNNVGYEGAVATYKSWMREAYLEALAAWNYGDMILIP